VELLSNSELDEDVIKNPSPAIAISSSVPIEIFPCEKSVVV
jgi:hypothetical protein